MSNGSKRPPSPPTVKITVEDGKVIIDINSNNIEINNHESNSDQ